MQINIGSGNREHYRENKNPKQMFMFIGEQTVFLVLNYILYVILIFHVCVLPPMCEYFLGSFY